LDTILSEEIIPRFKRTKKYVKEDFRLLTAILSEASELFVTPNILTEVANLANSLSGDHRAKFSGLFAKHIQVLNEQYLRSSDAVQNAAFHRFGLTDAGIAAVLQPDVTLLTDDFPLAEFVRSQNGAVINFNNLRAAGWQKFR
jgi:hypothetical protein